MSKRLLQALMIVLALTAMVTAFMELSPLRDRVYEIPMTPKNLVLDSNLRFFSGVWLALGLTAIWLVPSIETKAGTFRVVWGMMFCGGIGRIISMLLTGIPPALFVFFATIEVAGAPLAIFWQYRVANSSRIEGPMPLSRG
jgi:hypothetical protein